MLEFFVPSPNRKADGSPANMDGTNDMIQYAKLGPGPFTSWKAKNESNVAAFAQVAMYQQGWKAPEGRVRITLTWVEVSTARDVDNIQGGVKYVLDALCKGSAKHKRGVGVIKDDSQKYVRKVDHEVEVDKANPGVWIRIEEESDHEVSGS